MASLVASINFSIWRLLVAVTVIVGLSVFKDLLLPIAIAALIAFLLTPIVSRLQPQIGRVTSVLITAGVAFSIIGILLWITASQIINLAWELPSYQDNLRNKIAALSPSKEGPFAELSAMFENLAFTAESVAGRPQPNSASAEGSEPIPVRLVPPASGSQWSILRGAIDPVLRFLGPAGAVVILCLFMLVKRDDLRDRIIGLIGRGRISQTTVAMSEAARRVTRYLRSLLIVNLTYGIPVAIGLYLIGMPNAVLWGLLSFVLRFVPYVGPLIAMLMPTLLAFAAFESWTPVLMTVALFVVLELISNNIVEPWLYGSSTGISPFSLIVASLFWIWLWGIPGLVLSTPLTVCLLVMGRHVPHLSFISTLLSEKGTLTSAETAYHRLVAHDYSAFREVVKEARHAGGDERVVGDTLLPTLAMMEEDFRRELLDRNTHSHSLDEIRDALQNLILTPQTDGRLSSDDEAASPIEMRLVCVPADSLSDELGAEMLAYSLKARGFDASALSSRIVTSELCEQLKANVPAFIWVCAVNPSGIARSRILLKELDSHIADLRSGLAFFHPPHDVSELLKTVKLAHLECALTSYDEVLLRSETLRAAASDDYLPAPIPDTDAMRINALLQLEIGSSPDHEEMFTKVTSELTRIFDVPIALVSLVDVDSQVFAGQSGLPPDLAEKGRTPRSMSVCGHVAAGNIPFVIPDLLRDPRFAGNPLIRERQLRFYAGVPLRTRCNHAIGSLCILDLRPRTISKREVYILEMMAANLMSELEGR